MKLVLTILLTSICFSALAKDIEIYSTTYPTYDEVWFENTEFRVNPSMGRAWVETDQTEEFDWEDDISVTKKIKVPGLSYNAATSEVIFNDNGNKIVCATSYVRTRLRTTRIIRNTGRCSFKESTQTTYIDDGFNGKRVKETKLILSIR